MHYLYRGLVSAVLVLAFVAPSMGRESDFPVPDTVSPQLQAMIGAKGADVRIEYISGEDGERVSVRLRALADV